MSDRVKFSGGPSGSTSWAYWNNAELVVEFYDHGEEAEAAFGHDVAYLLHLDVAEQRRMAELLSADLPALPKVLANRFTSYFDVKAWLDQQGIPYRHEFDSWA